MTETMTWHQNRAAESRRAILEAAERVFLRDGYKTSIDAICAESEVSRRTLYVQFGSKEQLFRAWVEEASVRVLADLFKLLDRSADPEAVITRFANHLLDLVTNANNIKFLRLCISEVSQFPDLATRHYETGMGRILTVFTEYLEGCMADGKIPKQPAKLLAEQLLSCFIGYRQYRALLGLSDQNPADQAAYLANVMKVLKSPVV